MCFDYVELKPILNGSEWIENIALISYFHLEECKLVQRFTPGQDDTGGFFISKFEKVATFK